ncbi:MAG: hypothetical protein ACI9R3_003731 [Verrucomicrobiales bacterium]
MVDDPSKMGKVAYTPKEFADLFGKSQTWGYRQLYAGKVKAITKLGRIMIPAAEVERVLGEADLYGRTSKKEKNGGGVQAKGATSKAAPGKSVDSGGSTWGSSVKKRRTQAGQPRASARSAGGRKPSSPKHRRPCVPATSKP